MLTIYQNFCPGLQQRSWLCEALQNSPIGSLMTTERHQLQWHHAGDAILMVSDVGLPRWNHGGRLGDSLVRNAHESSRHTTSPVLRTAYLDGLSHPQLSDRSNLTGALSFES